MFECEIVTESCAMTDLPSDPSVYMQQLKTEILFRLIHIMRLQPGMIGWSAEAATGLASRGLLARR